MQQATCSVSTQQGQWRRRQPAEEEEKEERLCQEVGRTPDFVGDDVIAFVEKCDLQYAPRQQYIST